MLNWHFGPTWPEVQSVRILLFIEKKGGCPAVKKNRSCGSCYFAAENGKHGQTAVLRK